MFPSRLRVVVASLVFVALPGIAVSQEGLTDLGSKRARVDRAARGGRLRPGGPSHLETVREFLRGRHDDATLSGLVQARDHAFRGVSHVTLRQQVAGLEVYGTYVRASFAADRGLLSVVENLVSTARALRPAQIGPEAALAAVLERFYPGTGVPTEQATVAGVTTFNRAGPLVKDPTATRIALPFRGAVLDTGFLVSTWDRDNVLRHTVVSGRGDILHVELRTSPDTYRIFPVNPAVTPQQLVQGPDSWLGSSTTTTGNNADAYIDANNDDVADPNSRPFSQDQVFDYTWSPAAEPTTALNRLAAVTNLFVLNNVAHDMLYAFGFTESAGNFQVDNFGNGGLGGDPVQAEGQDGGGLNNANFATPPDGEAPRMQMYLWNSASPLRDGTLDADIVYHEYGHGLTWRMIGDMSGATGMAVGEGMSDALAIYFTGDDRLAEYSYNNPLGIRQYPYTNYPRTYAMVVGILGPHLDGEIYAATMWRLRQLWLANGWSINTLLRYIVDGMNYTTPRPAFEDMRDGILASIDSLATEVPADEATCTVWNAFAQFGIGVGASGEEICALGLCFFRATESFATPAECAAAAPNTAPLVIVSSPPNGITVAPGDPVTFVGSANDPQDGDLTQNLVWTSSIQGPIGTGATFTRGDLAAGTHTITASVTDSGGLAGSGAVVVIVQAPNTAPVVTITSPSGPTTVAPGTPVAFAATANDAQQGNLSAGLAWTSSLQGQIGTGASFSRSDLVAGAHLITATVTDAGGLIASSSVQVTVQAQAPFTLSATSRKQKGTKLADLSWSGATSGSIDVYRNSAKIATVANSGSYTDTLPKKGNTFTYQICHAGTQTCSNSTTVQF